MGSNIINFKNFATEPTPASSNRPPGIASLARQSSVYSLTFDEFQNTVGGIGKDFGSMNMDELLKSIWSAEENQTVVPNAGSGGQDGNLQRQISLTLPRTLSQKRVDEVWKELGGSAAPQVQRQQTLGEVTLEEFLARAGVVREDAPVQVKGGSIFGELLPNNDRLEIGFQQNGRGLNMMGMKNVGSVNQPIPVQSPSNLPLNINGVRPNQPSSQTILPKQTAAPYASQILSSGGARGGFMGMGNQLMPNNLVQGGGGMGMVGLGGRPTMGAAPSSLANPTTLDAIPRSNGDISSLAPVPCVFNGSMRGRKSGGVIEKVVERRQRRMIKNRESAARSRARKQAYTTELEAEIAKLKEENEKLQKKQEKIMQIEKNQNTEVKNMKVCVKRLCLRRTLTGPW